MTIRRDGPESTPWCVYDESGSELVACHETEGQAKEQLAAIEAAKNDSVLRFDRHVAGKVRRTPQGGVRVPGTYTLTGVFSYCRADGSMRREYRPPDEVFNADSVASLEGAPVTDDHPPQLVTPSTWRQYAGGHVLRVDQTDRGIGGELALQDGELAGKALRRDVEEISCGYRCQLDHTPGETPAGEKYDAVQRNIRYNHVALVARGRGRQGREAALRMDSSAAILSNNGAEDGAQRRERDMPDPKRTIKVDGIEFEAGSQSHLDAVAKREKEFTERADKAEKERDELKAERDELIKERDGLKEKTDALPQKVQELTKLREDAAKVLGSDEEIPYDERKIREAVVKSDAKDLDLSKASDDYVRARFDAVVEKADARAKETPNRSRTDAGKDPRRDAIDPPSKKGNGAPEKREDKTPPWKRPLTASADK